MVSNNPELQGWLVSCKIYEDLSASVKAKLFIVTTCYSPKIEMCIMSVFADRNVYGHLPGSVL